MITENSSLQNIFDHAGTPLDDVIVGQIRYAEDPLGSLLWEQMARLIEVEKDLRRTATRIADRLAELQTNLDFGYHVNSEGVVQDLGLELDRLCARRQDTAGIIGSLLAGWNAKVEANR